MNLELGQLGLQNAIVNQKTE